MSGMNAWRLLSKGKNFMAIDFSKCEIRTPESPLELKRLYQMLAEVFPVEKDFFEGLIDGARTLYNWRPYTLYHGDEPLGNVSVVMFQLKSGTGLQETAGIASVATPERHRGMGIARQLMEHVLKKIDGRNLPSVLFTSMPRVYSGLGYQVVDQGVMQVSVKPMVQADGLTILRLTRLDSGDLATIEKLYSGLLPYDGKLIRDQECWHHYASAVNNSSKTEFAFCRQNGSTLGYARLEHEADRILLDEFYAPAASREVNTALWNWACEAAGEKSKKIISLALPPAHGLWNLLNLEGLAAKPETGMEREVFMVRMPMRKPLEWLPGLRWPLSGKF